MDFSLTDQLAEHRAAAREWVRANARPEWAAEQARRGDHHTPELHALLARDGILAAGWPPELGGSDVDPDFARAVQDELYSMGIVGDAWATTRMVLLTMRHVAPMEQQLAYIPAALRGEVLIALGYSEPDSGSDVAAAKTRAVRDGDEWVINGQKMFTSAAQVCTHVFVLARTDPDVPKHTGLTMFLIPTDAHGYERQPIYTLGGQVTNATFYTDVRVPDAARVGGVDDGWSVMHVALVYERGGGGHGSTAEAIFDKAVAWARTATREDGTTYYDDPINRERLARVAMELEVARLLGLRVQWMNDRGELPGVEGSMHKLFWSETDQRHYEQLVDMMGAEGALQPDARGAPAGGEVEAAFRSAVVGTIYGGASEVQREIIAERRLGLPRSRPSSQAAPAK
ncbi:MAG TPA: acyl-CoA dehydrogenase family protein [Acidimicrobiales bacterium]|nr:acyl-CoA dehydrogenase family protein [Acidimicrobiales bacterium]